MIPPINIFEISPINIFLFFHYLFLLIHFRKSTEGPYIKTLAVSLEEIDSDFFHYLFLVFPL